MTLRPRGPLGLLGRILAILLLTVVVEFGASTLLYERASRFSLHEDEAHRLAEALVVTRRLLAGRPPAERPALARLASPERYAMRWGSAEPPRPLMAPELALMTQQVAAWEPELAGAGLNLRLVAARPVPLLVGSLRLPDGSWLHFEAHEPAKGWELAFHRILLATIPAAALLVIGALLIGGTLRPLRRLAAATDRIGYGAPIHLDEEGSSEVRRLIRAYNAMQQRIHGLVEDRTQALAAVGHDLRTPIARLQLRAAAIAEPGLRREVEGDLGEVEAMLASLLAFLAGEADPEPAVAVDLAVMAATIADGFEDDGHAVDFAGPAHLELPLRASAMRRAIANLVENAIIYGGVANVSLARDGAEVVLAVEDEGPGIPADRREQVLHPFFRLDDARARSTRGLGLGLAIVARAMEREGGRLVLGDRAGGGLRAELRLPSPN